MPCRPRHASHPRLCILSLHTPEKKLLHYTINPDNSCDSDSSPAKAPSLIVARRSGPLRGICRVQTCCLSQGQL